MTTKDPATSKDREHLLAAEIRRLDQRCRCLEHRLERMRTQQVRQKRIDDSNRHLLKRTNERLQRCHIEAERRSNSKSDFLANMSHEIRTPLNIILGMAALLADTPLDKTQTQYLNSLRVTGRQLLEIINNVLEFSRIDAGMVAFEPEPFSLEKIIAQLEASIVPLCVQKDLHYEVRHPPELVMERIGDPIKIYQILLNLINNAVKFTAVGSIVLEIAEDDEIPGNLRLSIRDTGIGISAEHQKIIFDRFVQVHDLTSRALSGSGLGLAISRRLTDAMGGRLTVDSRQGAGATFVCSLPLPAVPPDERGHIRLDASPLMPQHFPELKALIVDDIRENAEVVKVYLKDYPIRTEVAENGEEALDRLESGTFDIILMDIRMPVMDGLTATELIRRRELQGLLPRQTVLAITAHAFQEQKKRIVESGFDGVLSKPFFKRDLLQAIYRHVVMKKSEVPPFLGNKALGFCLERERPQEVPAELHDLVPVVLASIADDLAAMGRAMRQGDIDELRGKAHALRGVAGMYGFEELASLVQELSRTVKAGDRLVAGELLAALQHYLARLARSGPGRTSSAQGPGG